jgi:hypothetical protein
VREQPLKGPACGLVALASDLFETSAVRHRDQTSALLNQPSFLETSCNQADGGALHSQRVCQELVCQQQMLAPNAILGAENPSTTASFDAVDRVAGDR